MTDPRDLVARALTPLSRRLRLMIARAVVTAIDDAGKIQAAQVKLLDGEVRDGAEILLQYGFTSLPLGDREGLYFSVGGDRDHGVMICVADRKYRLKNLAPGETAVYTDEDLPDSDHRIHLKRGKEIHLIAGASTVVMTPDEITVSAPQRVTLVSGATSIVLTPAGATMTAPQLDIAKG